MELKKDRRYLDRFEIPGAKVIYKQREGFHGAKAVSAQTPLIDLTYISCRFEVNHTLQPGAIVELQILISGKRKIKVVGYIVWVSDAQSGRPSMAVVQFFPFGTDKRYNSLHSLKQLKKLSAQYLSPIRNE